MRILSLHLRHDATIATYREGVYCAVELERITGIRHIDLHKQRTPIDLILGLDAIHLSKADFDMGITIGEKDPLATEIFRRLEIAVIKQVDHHLAHAACAFYQSPFDESIVISYDGGGNDGTFRIFRAQRDGIIKSVGAGLKLNLGIPYRALAYPIAQIWKPDDRRELSNAGKLMGLAAYGKVRPEWVAPLKSYFQRCARGGRYGAERYMWVVSQLIDTGRTIGLDWSRNSLEGTDGHDLAHTGQFVFEELFMDAVSETIRRFGLPVCITGGCALNVLTNQRLARELNVEIFVPPNPNDCGLAVGGILWHTRPAVPASLAYTGIPILDNDSLPDAVEKFGAVQVGSQEVARLLAEGNVIAVMRGLSEHGPRALGNRSIICDPRIPGMRNRLNQRVKFREEFRPYAPLIRDIDVDRYFEDARNDMAYMSFNPTFRGKWGSDFDAAMHIDRTARVQVVTNKANSWLYSLIGEFAELTGHGVLLNTSFNTKGKPILSRIDEALEVLISTDLDYLLIEEWLIKKPS